MTHILSCLKIIEVNFRAAFYTLSIWGLHPYLYLYLPVVLKLSWASASLGRPRFLSPVPRVSDSVGLAWDKNIQL
jgi:hypothetical protein